MKRSTVSLILLFSLLGACQGSDDVEPTGPSASATSSETSAVLPTTHTPTRRPTNTTAPSVVLPSKTPRPPSLTPTLTPIPADNLTPIATPTLEGWQSASETSGLIPNRRWLIFHRDDTGQFGGFNVDGTGLTWFDLHLRKNCLNLISGTNG